MQYILKFNFNFLPAVKKSHPNPASCSILVVFEIDIELKFVDKLRTFIALDMNKINKIIFII
jgi:hypothetical protein